MKKKSETDDNKALQQSNAWEERVRIVRRHFENKGYRCHSGLQFGCELVLYADRPDLVHSDFCVHVIPEGIRSFGRLFGQHYLLAECRPVFAYRHSTHIVYLLAQFHIQ